MTAAEESHTKREEPVTASATYLKSVTCYLPQWLRGCKRVTQSLTTSLGSRRRRAPRWQAAFSGASAFQWRRLLAERRSAEERRFGCRAAPAEESAEPRRPKKREKNSKSSQEPLSKPAQNETFHKKSRTFLAGLFFRPVFPPIPHRKGRKWY